MLRDYEQNMTYVLSQPFLHSEVHLKQIPGKTYTGFTFYIFCSCFCVYLSKSNWYILTQTLEGRSLKAGMIPLLYLFLNRESHQFIDDTEILYQNFIIIEYEFNEKVLLRNICLD